MKKGSTGNRYTKRKLTKYHKQMLKADAMDNQDIYKNNLMSLGGFDPAMIVETDIYTEINHDFGNTKWNHNPIQERVDDLITEYLETLKLDPNKKGSWTRNNETAKHMQTCNLGHEHFVS